MPSTPPSPSRRRRRWPASRRAQPLHAGDVLRRPRAAGLGAARARGSSRRPRPANALYPYWTVAPRLRRRAVRGRRRGLSPRRSRSTPVHEGPRQPGPLLRGARPQRRGRSAATRRRFALNREQKSQSPWPAAQPRPAADAASTGSDEAEPLFREALRDDPPLPAGPLPARRPAGEGAAARRRRSRSSRKRPGSTPPTPSPTTPWRVSTGGAAKPTARTARSRSSRGSRRKKARPARDHDSPGPAWPCARRRRLP